MSSDHQRKTKKLLQEKYINLYMNLVTVKDDNLFINKDLIGAVEKRYVKTQTGMEEGQPTFEDKPVYILYINNRSFALTEEEYNKLGL